MKRKWLAIGIILLFLGSYNISSIAQDIPKSLPASRGNWLYVGGSGPGNYTTIQSAIDDANPGDTVCVYNGTYTEKLVINKTIDVIGEDRDTTVIDGGGTAYVVSISSDGVMISGFTVQNGIYGIYLDYSSNNNIIGNNASHNEGAGIYLYYSNNSIIEGNNAHSNIGYGISLDYSTDNIIEGNNVHSNTDFGIFLALYSYNNTIEGNNVHSNTAYGIFLYYGDNNIIEGNNVHSNTDIGIVLFSCSNNNYFYHNNLINNSQNALDQGSNTWDNGYPSGGNYWSDYTGTDNDGDGIGDTPYNISGGNKQDRYPLMFPYEIYFILDIILPNIPIYEGNAFPVVVYSLANLPIFNAMVTFNNETTTTDDNGTAWLTAPAVEIDTYYEISATKLGYTSDNDTILVKNIPQELLRAFIFGRYTNLTENGGYITIEAVNLWLVFFGPFQVIHYGDGETVTLVSDTAKVFLLPGFIIGLVEVVT